MFVVGFHYFINHLSKVGQHCTFYQMKTLFLNSCVSILHAYISYKGGNSVDEGCLAGFRFEATAVRKAAHLPRFLK